MQTAWKLLLQRAFATSSNSRIVLYINMIDAHYVSRQPCISFSRYTTKVQKKLILHTILQCNRCRDFNLTFFERMSPNFVKQNVLLESQIESLK